MGDRGEALDRAINAFAIAATSEAGEVIARSFPQELTKLEGHSGAVNSAAFSPDGQRVVTASDDHTVHVWNAGTGQVLAKLEGYSAAFSPDGQRVVTASGDKTARVWNAATGQVIAKLEGHSAAVTNILMFKSLFTRDECGHAAFGMNVFTVAWEAAIRAVRIGRPLIVTLYR